MDPAGAQIEVGCAETEARAALRKTSHATNEYVDRLGAALQWHEVWVRLKSTGVGRMCVGIRSNGAERAVRRAKTSPKETRGRVEAPGVSIGMSASGAQVVHRA